MNNDEAPELWRQAFYAFKRASDATKVGDMSGAGFDRSVIIWGHFERIIDDVSAIPNHITTMQTKPETHDIVLELKLPVPVKELASITDALCKIHGKGSLFMRQVGSMLQIYKPAAKMPNDES